MFNVCNNCKYLNSSYFTLQMMAVLVGIAVVILVIIIG